MRPIRCLQAFPERTEGSKTINTCEQYLRRNCCCSRAHDFYEPQPFEALQKSRIPNDLMASMKPLYINKEVLSGIEHKAKQPPAEIS
ncbi:unnamed protein product [Arctogadus glacialis]